MSVLKMLGLRDGEQKKRILRKAYRYTRPEVSYFDLLAPFDIRYADYTSTGVEPILPEDVPYIQRLAVEAIMSLDHLCEDLLRILLKNKYELQFHCTYVYHLAVFAIVSLSHKHESSFLEIIQDQEIYYNQQWKCFKGCKYEGHSFFDNSVELWRNFDPYTKNPKFYEDILDDMYTKVFTNYDDCFGLYFALLNGAAEVYSNFDSGMDLIFPHLHKVFAIEDGIPRALKLLKETYNRSPNYKWLKKAMPKLFLIYFNYVSFKFPGTDKDEKSTMLYVFAAYFLAMRRGVTDDWHRFINPFSQSISDIFARMMAYSLESLFYMFTCIETIYNGIPLYWANVIHDAFSLFISAIRLDTSMFMNRIVGEESDDFAEFIESFFLIKCPLRPKQIKMLKPFFAKLNLDLQKEPDQERVKTLLQNYAIWHRYHASYSDEANFSCIIKEVIPFIYLSQNILKSRGGSPDTSPDGVRISWNLTVHPGIGEQGPCLKFAPLPSIEIHTIYLSSPDITQETDGRYIFPLIENTDEAVKKHLTENDSENRKSSKESYELF